MPPLVLGSQLLGEIVATLRAAPKSASGRELRRAARISLYARILLARWTPAGPLNASSAVSRDISSTGVGLITGTPYAIGDALVLLLPLDEGHYEGLLARVAFTFTPATSLFHIGATFTDILSPETTLGVVRFFLTSAKTPPG